MLESNNILRRAQEIKDYIANAELEMAVKRFIDFTLDFADNRENEAIVLSMDYRTIENELNKGIVSLKESKPQIREIAYRILQTLDSIIQNFEEERNNS